MAADRLIKPTHRSTFLSSDNIQLSYIVWPAHNTEHNPCLLLHGFSNQADIWQPLAEALQAQGFSVYALDFRGHGLSQWDPACDYSHERLKQDVLEFLQHLQMSNCHIVAHSLGARIASLLIAQLSSSAHHQIHSFCLVDTGPDVCAAGVAKVRRDAEAMPQIFNTPEEYLSILKRIYLLADQNTLRAMADYSLQQQTDGSYRLNTDPEFTRYLWKPNSHQNNTRDLTAPLNQELWQALANINTPCLLIRGQISAILSTQTTDKMLITLANAKLKTIPAAGHAVMLDNAKGFIQAALNFIIKKEQVSPAK